MQHKKISIFLISMLGGFFFSSFQQHPGSSPYDICMQTIASCRSIKTMQYQMKMNERIHGEMVQKLSFTKLQRHPYQVYIKQLAPKEGMEILYKSSESGNKALINPNGFPWVNVRIDPNSWKIRKNSHHSPLNAGYDLFIDILHHSITQYSESRMNNMLSVSYIQKTTDPDKYKIIYKNQDYGFKPYIVRGNEKILDIAREKSLNAYKILEKNPLLKNYNDVKEGMEIMLPTSYSSKMELVIDVQRMIPLSIKVFDEQGIFEEYQYSQIELDPAFNASDFDQDNENYDF